MARKFYKDFERDDGAPVTVQFAYNRGCPAHYGSLNYPGHPAEGPEIEIMEAFNDAGNVQLTDAEDERITLWLLENFEDDDGDYYDC